MKEMVRLSRQHNNLLFSVDEIKLMIINERHESDPLLIDNQATEIYWIIRRSYGNELYNNKKENKKKKYNTDVDIIGSIERQRLIEIEISLQQILTQEQWCIYLMLSQSCEDEYIQNYYNISRRTLYRQKNQINTIIFQIMQIPKK